MNEISIPLDTLATLTDLEGRPLARDASPEALCADIGSRYDFLDRPLSVQLEGACVLIRWAAESEEVQAQAARLLERAARRAHEGEHERVVALCRQALRFQPLLRAARRELARAYTQAGDRVNAITTLWQILRLDPGDMGAILGLGWLLLQEAGHESAEGLARMAMDREPSNADPLDLLGQALVQAGREAEALDAFGRALVLNPHSPGPRLGAAKALFQQGKAEESRVRLEELFKQAEGAEETGHAPPFVAAARELYLNVQKHLARRDIEPMRRALEEFRRRLEVEHGVPIRVTRFEEKAGWVQLAWTHGRDHHLVGGPPGLPELARLHLLGQQLVRVELEAEAYRAGKFRAINPKPAQDASWSGLFAGVAHDLRRGGFGQGVIDRTIQQASDLLRDLVCNLPLDMLSERRLRTHLPILAPAQFLSLHDFMGESGKASDDDLARLLRVLPRPLWRPALAMDGAWRVFCDELLASATDCSVPCRALPTFDLSLRLLRQWEASAAQLGPGGHYGLVDGFASILGLKGLYELREVHFEHQGTGEQAFSA
jgi:tetratricopeptide (TPR) repeat protein